MNQTRSRRNRDTVGSRTANSLSPAWRLFCAIELPESIHSKLENYVQEIKASSTAPASWTNVKNIHLTLKFFGNVQRSGIENLGAALDRATQGKSPIPVQVGKTGTFSSRGTPKVLWIGVEDPSHALETLNHSIEIECEKEGFVREERKFHPHLTIARLRDRKDASELAQTHLQRGFERIEFEARELILFRSELSSAGARYSIVSRHPLSE